MKSAPERIYLRRCPSGAMLPVVHEEPLEGADHVEYVRVDLAARMVLAGPLPGNCPECGLSSPLHFPGCCKEAP